jgi:hypothetical protein
VDPAISAEQSRSKKVEPRPLMCITWVIRAAKTATSMKRSRFANIR